jgi:hypothetical protein
MRRDGAAILPGCLVLAIAGGCGDSRGTLLVLDAGRPWQPAVTTTWQIQLTGTIDPSLAVEVYDLDLDVDAGVLASVRSQGARALCNFSVGTLEDWRADANSFPASVLGNRNGASGQIWLDLRAVDTLLPLMQARLDRCRSQGFDGVDGDDMDTYLAATGFPLTAADQLAYNRRLADAAHDRGLAMGLRNDLAQVTELLGTFDWAMSEQCFEYAECDAARPFVAAGKPVFGVEYNLDTASFCPQANAFGFNAMKKNASLDAPRWPCR